MRPSSALVRSLQTSATVDSLDRARLVKNQGLDVLSFSAGEPDFPTPEHIVASANASLQAGFTHYVPSRGIPKLLDAIAGKLLNENGIKVDPAKEIIVTTGSKMAIYITLVALLDPGDEVLYLQPAWVSYEPMIKLAAGKAVPVRLSWQHGFRLHEAQLASAVTPRTKAIIINSPNNPTGCMLSLDELSTIDRFANKHDLFVLSDEIYDRICYETPHVSPASLPGLAQRTLTLNGFSKAYAMTGWRLGYVAGNRDLITQILRVQQHIVTCAASFAQEAAVAALVGSQEPLHNMRREYRKRRDVMVSTLNAIPGVSCPLPAGAFYAFPRFERYHSSAKLASQLLDKAAVSSIPGIAFGEAGEGHIRFSYACEMQEIEKGMERLNKLLS